MRQLDIGERDRRQDRFAGEIHAEQSANRAVRPVGSDQILRPPTRLRAAMVRPCPYRHPVGVLFEPDDFDAASNHGALRDGVGAQRLVDIGLRGDHRELVRRVEVGQVDAGAAENGYTRSLVRTREQIVGDSAGVQYLQRARHRGERAA
jgi:hypothetical protein